MRIGICEDNPSEASALLHIIDKWAAANKRRVTTRVFESAEAFIIRDYPPHSFDMLFLDIQMGPMDGMRLAQMIRQYDAATILVFVSRLRDYAVKGYDVNATHFLVKPVNDEACRAVLDKASRMIEMRRQDFLIVNEEGHNKRLLLRDVYYFETDKHYIYAHGCNGVTRFRENISAVDRRLPKPAFSRCHRSAIVNMAYVALINQSKLQLNNPGQTVLPVSQTYWEALNQAYLDYYVKW